MLSVVKKLTFILDGRERRSALIVLGMMIVAALLEVAGVASILPFIGVLSNPSVIHTNPFISAVYGAVGFAESRTFLLFLGSVLLLFFLASLAFRALTVFAIQRFSMMRINSISVRLLTIYMGQPYEFFLNRNSSSLAKSLLSEVNTVAGNILMPSMRALSGVIVSSAIIVVLVLVEPITSLILSFFFVTSYLLVDRMTKRNVELSGKLRLKANDEQYIVAGEAIQGIKELRLLGRETDYLARFKSPSRAFSHHQSTMMIAREIPFYFIQAVAFGGMMLILLYWIIRGDEIHQILPLISFFAFAGYRLLPAFQDVFRSVGQMRFSLPALDELVADLALATRMVARQSSDATPLPFRQTLKFRSVGFRYHGAQADTLTDFNLEIPCGGRVALVGHTGAGKSTIVDLLLGLLSPTSGNITVDGIDLTQASIRSWQENLGYVPQQIFLSDETIAGNIAFGVPSNQIDLVEVERAAKQAHIHDFIVGELPMGYRTVIGERGARLSGGQRQRLGIARALYRNAKVIVFDEATSALDNQTEAAVIDALSQIGQDRTIVMVAHRLSTIRACDMIFVLEKGNIVASGDFETLMRDSPQFRELAASPIAS